MGEIQLDLILLFAFLIFGSFLFPKYNARMESIRGQNISIQFRRDWGIVRRENEPGGNGLEGRRDRKSVFFF